jgi:hypothetical protein
LIAKNLGESHFFKVIILIAKNIGQSHSLKAIILIARNLGRKPFLQGYHIDCQKFRSKTLGYAKPHDQENWNAPQKGRFCFPVRGVLCLI